MTTVWVAMLTEWSKGEEVEIGGVFSSLDSAMKAYRLPGGQEMEWEEDEGVWHSKLIVRTDDHQSWWVTIISRVLQP